MRVDPMIKVVLCLVWAVIAAALIAWPPIPSAEAAKPPDGGNAWTVGGVRYQTITLPISTGWTSDTYSITPPPPGNYAVAVVVKARGSCEAAYCNQSTVPAGRVEPFAEIVIPLVPDGYPIAARAEFYARFDGSKIDNGVDDCDALTFIGYSGRRTEQVVDDLSLFDSGQITIAHRQANQAHIFGASVSVRDTARDPIEVEIQYWPISAAPGAQRGDGTASAVSPSALLASLPDDPADVFIGADFVWTD